MTPQLSARLVISTNKGPPNESTTGFFELIGQIDTLTDISDRIHRLENQVLQPGFVGYFDRDFSHGWDKYGLAEGRYIVGQFSKLKELQGIALTPGENRAVSAHDHSLNLTASCIPIK